jgi:hypothetical protein
MEINKPSPAHHLPPATTPPTMIETITKSIYRTSPAATTHHLPRSHPPRTEVGSHPPSRLKAY